MKSNSQEISAKEKILNFLIKLPQYVGAIIKFLFFLAVFIGAVFLLKQCS